jgi:hypothetical protein
LIKTRDLKIPGEAPWVSDIEMSIWSSECGAAAL